jgi:hypothetical protein
MLQDQAAGKRREKRGVIAELKADRSAAGFWQA